MVLEALGGTCAATAWMAYAVRGRSSSVFGPSVYRGDSSRRAVALTFDDGPSESTPELLEILERYRARATFFQCGVHVKRLPEVARAVTAAGHEVGNHTWSHARLWLRPGSFVANEIESAQRTIEEIAGVKPRLFRAPYGVRWFGLRAVQRRLGLLGVMWTALARDWTLPAGRIVRRLSTRVGNGAIFCLHDGREAQARPDIRATLEAVRTLLPVLTGQGYRLETVSQILCPTT